jgi:putative membrane protein
MMNGFDGMMGGWGIFGWLMMITQILFWGGLLAVIIWAVMRIFPNRRAEGGGSEDRADSAEEILRARFARGEIEDEEYERSIGILRGGAARRNEEFNSR